MPLHYHGLSGTFSSAHRNFTRLNKLRACDRPLHCGSCNFENFKNTTCAHISRNALAFIRFSILKCIEDVIIPHTWHALLYYWDRWYDMTILRGRGDTGSGRLHRGWSGGANLFRLSQPGSDWAPHMDDRYLVQGTEIRVTQYKHGGNKAATSRKLH